jgi:mannose-6-phosphate isomerase
VGQVDNLRTDCQSVQPGNVRLRPYPRRLRPPRHRKNRLMPRPVRLTPSLREKVWGKTRLEPWFANSAAPIGEAWFVTDRELPLLVKLIFTSARLSVQVHPDDGEDGPRGKTEMWYILEAEPGATIAIGFREPITRDRLLEATHSGEVERLLNWIDVKPGETYFTPAHTVHAIGAGIVLCEIQQDSDVTYRLWDYGRPRPIHVEQAVPISDLTVHPGAARPVRVDQHREELVRERHFVTELVHLGAGEALTPEAHQCQLWIGVEGHGTIGGEAYHRGDVWLLPEAGAQPELRATELTRFLRTWVP